MNRGLTFVATSVFALASISSASATTRYAKVNGSGTGNCDGSWSNACTLDHALDIASPGDEVWVQAGTYPPIALVSGVNVIGGFAGAETSASDSNPSTNQTIIDGYGKRAVTSHNNDPTTMLRGFVIRNGNDTSTDGGGGLLITGGSPKIVDCIFENNKARFWGAATSVVEGATPEFVSCAFRNNGDPSGKVPYAGAAVHVKGASPTFVNCLFHDNRSGEGPGLAIVDGKPTLINCTFAFNRATIAYGGAIHDEGGGAVIRNCILWGNTAAVDSGQIWNLPRGPVTTVTSSNVEGGWSGAGNKNSDPLFADAARGDFRLTLGSPCKNAGQRAALPADRVDLDWDGNVTEKLALGWQSILGKDTIDMGVCSVRRR